MRTAYFDSGLRWDDPNLRWGDPSYVLEPGDPGYTPPASPPPSNPPHPKTKRMKRNAYYPSRAAEQVLWLENFRNKLTGHATALGLDAAVVTELIGEARWLIYSIGSWLPAVREWTKACTDAIAAAQSGEGSTPLVLPVFTPPALPSGVTPQNPGSAERIFAAVANIKTLAGYTEAIGTDLGIVGSGKTPPDLETVQPGFTAALSGNSVFLNWKWQGLSGHVDLLRIEVDRGTGGYQLLTLDSTPGYTDSTALPASPTKWKYRAIWILDDTPVGLWSAEVSITVGG
jgi:hypothetical protein